MSPGIEQLVEDELTRFLVTSRTDSGGDSAKPGPMTRLSVSLHIVRRYWKSRWSVLRACFAPRWLFLFGRSVQPLQSHFITPPVGRHAELFSPLWPVQRSLCSCSLYSPADPAVPGSTREAVSLRSGGCARVRFLVVACGGHLLKRKGREGDWRSSPSRLIRKRDSAGLSNARPRRADPSWIVSFPPHP